VMNFNTYLEGRVPCGVDYRVHNDVSSLVNIPYGNCLGSNMEGESCACACVHGGLYFLNRTFSTDSR